MLRKGFMSDPSENILLNTSVGNFYDVAQHELHLVADLKATRFNNTIDLKKA